jgi:hypothetical protein
MKSKIFLFTLLATITTAHAFAQSGTDLQQESKAVQEVSCLTPAELIKLQSLEEKLEKMKIEKPGCEHWYGSAACISPFDQAMMNYFLAKQAGVPQACQQ